MRQLWIVVALAGTGCNQLLGIDELTRIDAGGGGTIDSPLVDAAPIDSIDSPPAMTCAMLVSPVKCFANPIGAITIEGAINTDSDSRCVPVAQATGPELCAIIGDTITVPSAGATVTGAKPLLLLATTKITVTGVLDASSTIENPPRIGPAAGGTPPNCTLPAPGGGNDGHGGGAGGSFITKGGDGGDGAGNNGHDGADGAAALTTTFFRAGCQGSPGGGGPSGGPGGRGGGAIYLVAGTEIAISNRVIANGAGGTGATAALGGGGGGGSGGMIALDAPMVTLNGANAQVSANGGGGGEGTLSSNAREGNESIVWNLAATGGNGGSAQGGAGGVGSVLALPGLDGVEGTSSGGPGQDGGGGGGGGGGGLVWLKGTPAGAQSNQISPPYVPK